MMIVKVQASLFNSEGRSTVLIYNESRRFELEVDVGAHIMVDILHKLLAGRLKAYFDVVVTGSGKLAGINNEVEAQPW